MSHLRQRIRRFLVSEDGPTAVEYAIMLALIIIVCIAGIQQLGEHTSEAFEWANDGLATGS